MAEGNILLVEDELSIARGLIFNLEEEGYEVCHAVSGEKALGQFEKNQFDLVILDLTLPGIDGLEVCRTLRSRAPRLPILILTARAEVGDRIEGLAEGADDYLTKPFSLEEFLLRVRGMLKRSRWYRPEEGADSTFTFGANVVNLEERRAQTAEGEIALTELEAKMLALFFRREGEVISRKDMLAGVWDVSPETETRTLDNFIVRLRKYFEPDPSHPAHFLTVRGRGYRFRQRPQGGKEE